MVRRRVSPPLGGHLAQRGLGDVPSWLWTEHDGGDTAAASFDEVMAIPGDDPDEFWHLEIADPGALGLFLGAVYDRGAATLHALRMKIGDAAFFELGKPGCERFSGATASRPTSRTGRGVSGQDLGNFFETWLYTPDKPTEW